MLWNVHYITLLNFKESENYLVTAKIYLNVSWFNMSLYLKPSFDSLARICNEIITNYSYPAV